jgi:hypothetical protein
VVGTLMALSVAALVVYGVATLRSTESELDLGARPAENGDARLANAEPLALPSAQLMRSAQLFATERRGLISFAVIDATGRQFCFRCRASYPSASVSKAMLLVAYLNGLAAGQQDLSTGQEAELRSMIHVSDNEAADAIQAHVEHRQLHELAEDAGMTDFEVSDSWASARTTALDQARFFARFESVVAPEYKAYARSLLSSIAPSQSWGIPDVIAANQRIMFKGGWLTTQRGNLVHQVARIEDGASSLAVAILTDGNPTDSYGRETIRGIASRLLGKRD